MESEGLRLLQLRPGLGIGEPSESSVPDKLKNRMSAKLSAILAAAGVAFPIVSQAADYAESVVAYSPGVGFTAGYTNAAAVLGEPSRSTPGAFGGPVDPFNPPYLASQLVSMGAGGSLTIDFGTSVSNDPSHRFGIDFMIYANSGFVITNGDFTGGGVTDGSLFGGTPGSTRVSVSADNVHYYQLDPSRAPTIDALFPTDGAGSFDIPVNPALTNASFTGLDLTGIRALYDGSAGGTGFDLAWAEDANGQPVALPAVRFVRVDVLSGVADIDGFAAPGVVPEPGTLTLLGLGAGIFAVGRGRRQLHSR
jgi:hypothetical protein